MTKKIFAMFLALLMVVSLLPTSVFAADCPAVHTKGNCEYTEVKVTAPDCGNKGYTTYKCNACGETFVADFVDPVGEHTWKDADPVAETCEKNGSVGGKECTVCHKVVDATVVNKIPDGLKCEFGAWLPANVDCTTGGKQTATCAFCGNEKTREVAKVEGGHVMGAWELKTPATAEATGLAVKKCTNANCGYTVEQTVFFDHDHNDQTLNLVAQVDAKCNETGVKSHYECRVCGTLFEKKSGEYVQTTLAALEIKTGHQTIKDGLTCTSTTKECTVCKEIVKVDAASAHNYNEWVIEVAPGCLTDGFEKRTCKNCANTETQIIKPLGHDLQTVEVAATCVSFAYTYTYCTRANCANFVEVELPEEHNAAKYAMVEHKLSYITEAPVDGESFYLAVYQNSKYVNIPLYFAGAMEGNYLATTSDYREAVEVFVEVVEGGYRLYFKEGETKTYIEIYEWDTVNHKVGVHLTAEPKNVFTWNATCEVMTTTINGTEYYLGNYNTFTTFSASKISYITGNNASKVGVSQFPAKLAVIDSFEAAKVISYSIDKTAGVDANRHDWKVLSKVDATCLAEGVKISSCADCNAVKNETLAKAAHKWVADTTKGSDNDGVDEATCTTAGKKYFVCFYGCTETNEEAIAALDHDLQKNTDKTVKTLTHAGNHADPVAYDYNYCERCKQEVNKTNYRAWANAGRIWDTKEAAEAAHGTLTPAATTVAGSCTVVGYTTYTCSGCSEIVRVKIAGTGAHVFPEAGITIGETTYTKGYQAPTCTADGYSINYKCTRCKKLIDEEATENKLTVIPKLGHTWTEFTAEERETLELGEYEKAPCGAPVYDNYVAYCSVCNANGLADKAALADAIAAGTVKADTKLVEKVTATGALCEATIYELYECHCGETHMRGYIATGKNVNHEWIVDTTKTPTKPTHFEEGHTDMICKYCSAEAPEAMEVVAKLPHKNAADEEFTNACNDPITDRHCVLCCAAECKADKKHDCVNNKDEDGEADPCDCVITRDHSWGEVTYVDAICGDAPYMSKICSICYKTEAIDATEYWTGEMKDDEKVMAPIFGLGHKPVAADADKYGAYTYIEIVHPEYVWDNGVVVMTEASKVAYEAKYIEYKAATFTADGYAKFLCADCGEVVEQVLPALSGLGFELVAENANGQDGLTKGSLVNVTLYVSGSNVAVNHFELTAQFGTGMIFVGAQSANDDFGIFVTEAANAKGTLEIIANAVNTADKKQQNITIGDKTPIATMQFIVWTEEAVNVNMTGSAQDLAENDIKCAAAKECKIEVRKFMDFNDDGFTLISDLVQAEAILTGESEKTYDVTVDADKDGEITLYDLTLIYEYNVNKMDAGALNALIFVGMADEHVEIVREALGLNDHKHVCNNPYCSYTAAEAFEVCPACYKAQNKN